MAATQRLRRGEQGVARGRTAGAGAKGAGVGVHVPFLPRKGTLVGPHREVAAAGAVVVKKEVSAQGVFS